jgi:mono/diheme cytochrome c family protein
MMIKTAITLLFVALPWCAPACADEPAGKSQYLKICSACHQADGRGVPDAFPALAGNAFVQGDARSVASLPLLGRGGMPNFSKRLDDATLAAILNYVRSAWGNTATTITAEQIAALRAELHVDAADSGQPGNMH